MAAELSHLDASGMPRMVDVSAKAITQRSAHARCQVRFPAEIAKQLKLGGYVGKKGAILQTAIIAGVMAAKRTHELIPFCHALALERCEITIDPDAEGQLEVNCRCTVTGKTGVEMEALTGASIAALTIYDMCKALSHAITISELLLVEKTGGKAAC